MLKTFQKSNNDQRSNNPEVKHRLYDKLAELNAAIANLLQATSGKLLHTFLKFTYQ